MLHLERVMGHVIERRRNFMSTLHALQSEEFRDAWDRATLEQRQVILEEAEQGNFQQVRNWVKKLNIRTWQDQSFTNLRNIARSLGIPNYMRYDRFQLIHQIERAGYVED